MKKDYDLLNDEELVLLCKRKEEEAFCVLSQRYDRFISFYVRKYLIRGYAKEDLIQECNVLLWECACGFNEDRASFATYFSAAIRNRLCKITADNKKHSDNSLSITQRSVFLKEERNYAFNENDEILSIAEEKAFYDAEDFMDRITKEEQACGLSLAEMDCLRLRFEGYSVAQIAIIRDKNEKSISNALYRCKNKLNSMS